MGTTKGGTRLTYQNSGVDIDAGNRAIGKLLPFAKATHGPEVLQGIGSFGAAFKPNLQGFDNPVLVSGADGVGSKLKIAFMMDKHDTVGIDCVAMNTDDVICSGARPLFFLDYLGMHKVIPDVVEDIVKGVAEGCRQAGCALIGGETAELPDFYAPGEYDLAGFCVGLADQARILDGSRVANADVLIGLGSSGLHSNGYSLARKALLSGFALDEHVRELGRTVGEEMLEPTRIYAGVVADFLLEANVKSVAHITGGGFYENIPRALPKDKRARVWLGKWPIHPVFRLIQEIGNVEQSEMFRVFNMGIGMTLVVSREDAGRALEYFESRGQSAYVIGDIIEGERGLDILSGETR